MTGKLGIMKYNYMCSIKLTQSHVSGTWVSRVGLEFKGQASSPKSLNASKRSAYLLC